MITNPESPLPAEGLMKNAFYDHNGVIRIAVSEDTVQGLVGFNDYQVTAGDDISLEDEPNTPNWSDRMVRIRQSMAHRIRDLQTELNNHVDHFERLKKAILEQADEQNWCEVYDRFAEEWDLLPRLRKYNVDMTVLVTARNGDEARELVQSFCSFPFTGNEGFDTAPDFYVSEA